MIENHNIKYKLTNETNKAYELNKSVKLHETKNLIEENKRSISTQEAMVRMDSACRSTSWEQITPKDEQANDCEIDKPKRIKSVGVAFRHRYQKAQFILDKIAKNEANGKVDERDAADKAKYQAIVDDYNNYKNRRAARIALNSKRSQSFDSGAAAKRTKRTESYSKYSERQFNEIVKDVLHMTIVDEFTNCPKRINENWAEIEVRITREIMQYLLENPGRDIPLFDSAEILRDHRIIKCNDQSSLDFLISCIIKIQNKWPGIKLKLIQAKDIPRRPRARIWLPSMEMDNETLLRFLQLQNPAIAMKDWSVIRREPPNKTSMTFLLSISEDNLEPLANAGNKLRFGVRNAKLKIFKPTASEDEVNAIEEAEKHFDEFTVETDSIENQNKNDTET